MVKDNILHIEFGEFGNHYEMNFDLDGIARRAGVREEKYKDENGVWHTGTLILLPIPQARKIINTILKYADPEDYGVIGEAFRKNKKLYKIWKEKLDKWKE